MNHRLAEAVLEFPRLENLHDVRRLQGFYLLIITGSSSKPLNYCINQLPRMYYLSGDPSVNWYLEELPGLLLVFAYPSWKKTLSLKQTLCVCGIAQDDIQSSHQKQPGYFFIVVCRPRAHGQSEPILEQPRKR